MIGPLVYGNQNLGVLAVANGPMTTPFLLRILWCFNRSSSSRHSRSTMRWSIRRRARKEGLTGIWTWPAIFSGSCLPNAAPAFEGFEIAGLNIPASQVSGDYYDYITLDDQRLGIAIADVSGKGVRGILNHGDVPQRVALGCPLESNLPPRYYSEFNRQLYPDIKEDMFISMAYLIAKKADHELVLARAGHDAPLQYRVKDASVVKINPPGMALGIDSGGVFNRVTGDFKVRLETGDCLILYTDGVTEALDVNGLEFGISRLTEAIQASAADGAPAILSRVTGDLKMFVGSHPQNDDITLIAIRKL